VKEYLLDQKRQTDPTKIVTNKDVKEGVRQLRECARRHPEIAHYVRFNIARDCEINIGDVVPDILMARSSNMENVMLLDPFEGKQKPLVLVAGSIS